MSTYADAVMAIARGSACYAAKVRVSQTQPWHRAVLSPLGILHTHDQQQQADDTATSNFHYSKPLHLGIIHFLSILPDSSIS